MRTLIFALALFASCVSAGQLNADDIPPVNLGEIELSPLPTNPDAAAAYTQATLALHNFWFTIATPLYGKAAQLEPDFAMAHIGEALSNYWPLWQYENLTAANAALDRVQLPIADTRISMYYDAATLLFEEGTERCTRILQYTDALLGIVTAYPDDDEARALYAIGLMSKRAWSCITMQEWFDDVYSTAYTAIQTVVAHQPRHPGGAHYTIHICDDTVEYTNAYDAASVYGGIAPDSYHAQHMPSHIWFRYGYWDKGQAANLASWDASLDFTEEMGLSNEEISWHALEFYHYATLCRGQILAASSFRSHAVTLQPPNPSDWVLQAIAQANAEVVLLLERYQNAENLVSPLMNWDGASYTGYSSSSDVYDYHYDLIGNSMTLLARGVAAVHRRDNTVVSDVLSIIDTMTPYYYSQDADQLAVVAHLIQGMKACMMDSDTASCRSHVETAVALQDTLPPNYGGPPYPVVLPREIYSEMLLDYLEDPTNALAQAQMVLADFPQRSHTLIRAGRAAAALSEEFLALDFYLGLLENYNDADADAPGYDEAVTYIALHGGGVSDTNYPTGGDKNKHSTSTGSSSNTDGSIGTGYKILIFLVVFGLVALGIYAALRVYRESEARYLESMQYTELGADYAPPGEESDVEVSLTSSHSEVDVAMLGEGVEEEEGESENADKQASSSGGESGGGADSPV